MPSIPSQRVMRYVAEYTPTEHQLWGNRVYKEKGRDRWQARTRLGVVEIGTTPLIDGPGRLYETYWDIPGPPSEYLHLHRLQSYPTLEDAITGLSRMLEAVVAASAGGA